MSENRIDEVLGQEDSDSNEQSQPNYRRLISLCKLCGLTDHHKKNCPLRGTRNFKEETHGYGTNFTGVPNNNENESNDMVCANSNNEHHSSDGILQSENQDEQFNQVSTQSQQFPYHDLIDYNRYEVSNSLTSKKTQPWKSWVLDTSRLCGSHFALLVKDEKTPDGKIKDKRHRCKYGNCKRKTKFKCLTCEVFLCIGSGEYDNCFVLFHTVTAGNYVDYTEVNSKTQLEGDRNSENVSIS